MNNCKLDGNVKHSSSFSKAALQLCYEHPSTQICHPWQISTLYDNNIVHMTELE